MQISIPRQVSEPTTKGTGLVGGKFVSQGENIFIPIILESYDIEAPSYFHEFTHGLENNHVVHSKLVGYGGDLLFGNATATIDGLTYNVKTQGSAIGTQKSGATRYSLYWTTFRAYSAAAQRRLPVLSRCVISSRYEGVLGFYKLNVTNGGSISVYLEAAYPRNDRYLYTPTASLHLNYAEVNGRVQLKVNTVTGPFPYKKGDVLGYIDLDSSRTFSTKEEVWEYAERTLFRVAQDYMRDGNVQDTTTYRSRTRYVCSGTLIPNNLYSQFMFAEPDNFWLYGPRYYWFDYLRQTAYMDALQSAPKMNDNNLQNIAEICSFIYNLVVRHRVEVPRRLQDAWLAYRYTYGTGKMDVEEAIAFMRRTHDLGKITGPLKCYGQSSTSSVEDTNVTCKCTLMLQQKELSRLRSIWDRLATYGLTPNFYVLWDFVPYSFIVDWLIPVGDMLNVADSFKRYNENYRISRVCFSLQYQKEISEGYLCNFYTRWPTSPLDSLNEFYWTEKPGSSAKTRVYRIADTVSLITS